jgi:DNA-directed RNA polymerase specialized sigma24 family protein
MEDAARTEDDFKKVITQWNHLDKNRERKERYNEIGRSDEDMLHWDKKDEDDVKGKMREKLDWVIPRPIEYQWWRQLIRGDFIDTIYDCPHELHELVDDIDIAQLLCGLSEDQREILYYSAVRLHSNVRIAAYRGQTDRNIRKRLALMLKNVRDGLALRIQKRLEDGLSTTLAQREFLEWYENKKSAIDSDNNK